MKRAYYSYYVIKLVEQGIAWAHTWYAKHALRICVNGRRAWRAVRRLEYPWFGGNHQTMALTTNSSLLMCLRRTGKPSSILIFHQHNCRSPWWNSRTWFGEFSDSSDEETSSVQDEGIVLDNDTSHPFTKQELNDLFQNCQISFPNLWHPHTLPSDSDCITFYYGRHEEYLRFFYKENCVYCTGIAHLLHKLGVCEPKYWRLFIDSCKQSLICVMMHNSNKFASVSPTPLTRLHWRRSMKRWRMYCIVT